MTDRRPLLIEIGCEEIPARMLPEGARALAAAVEALLDRAGIPHGEPRLYWTPRRLAVLLPGTGLGTEAAERIVTGPPARAAWDAEGRPTRAAGGFARKQGVPPEALFRHETERGVYAAVRVTEPARPTGELLAARFEQEVARISFPKTMRWGDGRYQFVRPVHWLVALLGEETLPLSLFGVAAGRETRGHRVLAPGPHEVPSAGSWEAVLEEAHVIADPERRRAKLAAELTARATEQGGALGEDTELLAEVADMLEWPAALAGRFDERFARELPEPVLQTCLRHHQKAFLIRDAGGAIRPAFAVGVNMPRDPEGHIRRGHEWVVGGRLEDALFFWTEDRKRPLAARRAELDGVLFHEKLGHFGAKTDRVERLAAGLAEVCGLDRDAVGAVRRAASLSRCDLVTGTVGEFPELQGVAGALLAEADGEPQPVVTALAAFHDPEPERLSGGEGRVAAVVGIADRLDTLVGCFAAGIVPSGSRDPFALRRAGTLAVRLALHEPACDLRWVAERAATGYREQGIEVGEAVCSDVLVFLFDRFAHHLRDRVGARHDEVAAVRRLALRSFAAADLQERVRQLSAFRGSDDFHALAAAAKRVRNILKQARERGERCDPGDAERLPGEPAEVDLRAALAEVSERAVEAGRAGDYGEAFSRLARLRPAVDRFFDEILVMDEHEEVRRARLGLLARFHELAQGIVDIAELVVERQRDEGAA